MASLNISAIGDFASGPVKGADFIRLMGPDKTLPLPPRFTFGPCPASLMAKYYGLWGISSVGVFSLREFELRGNFLLGAGENYYRCPELNIHEAHIQAEVERVSPTLTNPQRKRLHGPHVVLSGPGHGVYGHWLVEYLPKISLLNFAGYDIHSLRYLLPVNTPSYVLAWLDLLGIGGDQIVRYDALTEIVAADELLLPTILHNGLRMSPLFKDAAAFLRGLIAFKHDLQGSTHGARIFLSRGQASQGRCLRNRKRIEELASQAKFSLVSPEKLSLVEQVRLFASAREIMGEYGSALHGSMFSPEGTVVCALRGTGGHPGFIQSGMGTALRQPTGYVFGELDEGDPNYSFQVEEEAVEAALRLVFGRLPI
ncbi:MAG: glycosyltransferase family 61 protein [Rhodopila sp.]|nr:glycosyltransferase family 61 protein [Rhodopila sp.]